MTVPEPLDGGRRHGVQGTQEPSALPLHDRHVLRLLIKLNNAEPGAGGDEGAHTQGGAGGCPRQSAPGVDPGEVQRPVGHHAPAGRDEVQAKVCLEMRHTLPLAPAAASGHNEYSRNRRTDELVTPLTVHPPLGLHSPVLAGHHRH